MEENGISPNEQNERPNYGGRSNKEIPDILYNNQVYTSNPEVGEGKPPTSAIVYKGGLVDVIKANSATLFDQGYRPYPHQHLTTNYALILTRALATYHATSIYDKQNEVPEYIEKCKDKKPESDELEKDDEKDNQVLGSPEKDNIKDKIPYRDQWTAEISKPELVEAHLDILCDRLQSRGHNPTTVQRLQSLQADLPTLTQFLQFSSTMQNVRVKSVGPIGICDVWVHKDEDLEADSQDHIIVRLRGGTKLESPHLRDAAWMWLTLLTPEMLRERYMEFCGVYCDHYNATLTRIKATDIEELSFFNVMQDLGENFLHAFLTIVHKFVMSGNWYMDRDLHTPEGLQVLADVISFLVDNGIIGSIFVI